MKDQGHWSYNRLSKFLRCPLAYFFEYELDLPKRFVPSNLVLGSAVHEALATYHRSIRAGTRCDRETVLGAFIKSWIEREAKEKVLFTGGDLKVDLMEQGGEVIRAYLQEPPPQQVIAVEETFISPIVTSDGKVLDKPLLSVLDLLTREPSGLTITDFKTAGRSMSGAEADMSYQANCYVNAISYNFDEPTTFSSSDTPLLTRRRRRGVIASILTLRFFDTGHYGLEEITPVVVSQHPGFFRGPLFPLYLAVATAAGSSPSPQKVLTTHCHRLSARALTLTPALWQHLHHSESAESSSDQCPFRFIAL